MWLLEVEPHGHGLTMTLKKDVLSMTVQAPACGSGGSGDCLLVNVGEVAG